jgi:hypothetical protein
MPNESVTRCDHIRGLALADFPQYGESDWLTPTSEGREPDLPFAFCPTCGTPLERGTPLRSSEDELVKRLNSSADLTVDGSQFINREG